MSYTFDFTPRQNSLQYTRRGRVTDRQIELYLSLCHERGLQPKNYMLMTYDEMSSEIQQLMANQPVSEAQRNAIKKLIERLQNMGIEIKTMSDSEISKLTGGRNGTASKLIESLQEIEQEQRKVAPPSDAQLEIMVKMYYCPDVPFEYYGIQKHVYLDEYVTNNAGERVQLRRNLTPEEFAQEIKSKMTMQDATEFLSKYRTTFNNWVNTRASQSKRDYIRTLEERLTNTAPNQTIGYEIVDGQIVQVFRSVKRGEMQNPTGYTPLSETELLQFSDEDADRYIQILRSEIENRDLYKFGEGIQILNFNDYTDYRQAQRQYSAVIISSAWNDRTQTGYIEINEEKHMTFEDLRSAKTANDWATKEFRELNNFLFALQAKTGIPSEEILVVPYQDDFTEATPSDAFFDDEVKKQKVKDYIYFALTDDYVTYNQITYMAQNSDVAKSLLLEVTKEIMKDEYLAEKILLGV